MKKNLVRVLLLAFAMCLLTVFVSAQEVRPVHVMLNGEIVDCAAYGQEATIVEGRTLVPLRAIFEALGASVEWDQTTKTVTSELEDTQIKLTIGENKLYRNGEAVEIDVPAMIVNGRTMVPARVVAESFGVFVEWDSSTRTVVLTYVSDKTETESPENDENPELPSDDEEKVPANEKDVPEEAKRVLAGCFDAVVEFNFAEAAKYSTNPKAFSELNITGVDDLLREMNFDRDSIAEEFVNSMAESEEDKEDYRAFGEAMADASFDMIKGAFEKIHYEVVSYEIVDAGRIKFGTVLYMPDITAVSESFGTVVEASMYYATAEIMAMGEELEGKSQKEIFDIMASSFRTISEEMTEQLIAETENVASEPSFGYLVKVDGEWLVELDGEDEWALGELKDLYFE